MGFRCFSSVPNTIREWTNRAREATLYIDPYTVATLPSPALTNGRSSIIFVTDESGGPTLAFNEGTNWRRVQDRAVVS